MPKDGSADDSLQCNNIYKGKQSQTSILQVRPAMTYASSVWHSPTDVRMTGLVLAAKLTTPQESTCDQSRESIVQSHNRQFHGNRIRGNPTRHLSGSSGDEIRDAFTSGET